MELILRDVGNGSFLSDEVEDIDIDRVETTSPYLRLLLVQNQKSEQLQKRE